MLAKKISMTGRNVQSAHHFPGDVIFADQYAKTGVRVSRKERVFGSFVRLNASNFSAYFCSFSENRGEARGRQGKKVGFDMK